MRKKIDYKKIKEKIKNVKKEELGQLFRKALYSPYLYLILGIFVGFLFTIQFKTQSKRPLSPILFYSQLKDIKLDFLTKKETLNSSVANLQKEVKQKEDELASKNLVSKSMLNDLSNQEMIFGSNTVVGEGVVVTLSDGVSQIKDEFSKSLTHAADLRDVVNLLWYAGAEAISVNDERIIYNTSIDCIVSTIMINNNNYVPPFIIKATGNKQDLENVINSSRKLVDIKKRADKKQIVFDIKKETEIRINRYTGPYSKQ